MKAKSYDPFCPSAIRLSSVSSAGAMCRSILSDTPASCLPDSSAGRLRKYLNFAQDGGIGRRFQGPEVLHHFRCRGNSGECRRDALIAKCELQGDVSHGNAAALAKFDDSPGSLANN